MKIKIENNDSQVYTATVHDYQILENRVLHLYGITEFNSEDVSDLAHLAINADNWASIGEYKDSDNGQS